MSQHRGVGGTRGDGEGGPQATAGRPGKADLDDRVHGRKNFLSSPCRWRAAGVQNLSPKPSVPPSSQHWRGNWQPTPVFLPGESHGQSSLAGYSPWGHKESDMTESHTHTHSCMEKEMATHSSILTWRIPWPESLVGYSPWGCKESDMTGRFTHTHTHTQSQHGTH